ncbi:porin [Aromatoleum toluclasticum]|uniref:porin n=1 Tax=Aromatoleum toluclasticum TaxID=92003 RepID=UPI001D18C5AB|nr:porin [Aromatoleum toluclasticum]MCC4114558.1 porin [Aromatoleum toluclasticum]
MHKKIIAAAIAALVAVPFVAQAQSASNVTIYGLLDLNLAREWAGDEERVGVDHGELNGSRLGFKGSEALGGDLNAIFTIESGFDPSTGTAEQGGRLFGRQSFVGLESATWGRLTLGRQYSPAFVAIDPFDATGAADRSPGLLVRKTGGIKPAYETRFDNMVKYRSPSFSGLEFDLGYWLGEKRGNGDAMKEGNGHGITALYKNGALAASLVTQSVYRNATGGRVRTSGGGLAYDFGFVKPYLAYTQDKESGSVGSGKARTFDIGAEIRVTGTDTVALSYAKRDESNDVAAEDAHGWSAYYMHDLSKRTTLYAAYSQLTNKDNANYALGNLTPAAGDDPRVVMAGIRHRF